MAEETSRQPAQRAVAFWLLACCGMLAAMVLLGGLTRLTHSGLSMVEWEPLIGAIPPLTEAAWAEMFEKYKLTPEYLKINQGMSLAGFKGIFWLEYIHRLWGRAIGVVFLLPFLWFLAKGAVTRALAPRLVGLFALGAAQGGMGWYMVKSGLVDNPAVSHYRLTAHLGLAFLIHALLLWTALDILAAHRRPAPAAAVPCAVRAGLKAVTALVVATFLYGGLVAGLRAGLIYNTFPLMDGHLIPDLSLPQGPIGIFEDHTVVQFLHRSLAETTLLAVLATWLGARRRMGAAMPAVFNWVGGAALVQFGLGVATLVLVVPVSVAAIHQLGALGLFSACLWALHETRPLERRRDPGVTLAAVGALAIFVAMPSWRHGDPPDTAAVVSPGEFQAKVESMVSRWTVATDKETGMPVVRPPAGSDVYLLARMWEWYPLLELERGGSYRLHLSSVDVVHGLAVRAGGLDLHVRPGREEVVAFTVPAAGDVDLVCNEYCGVRHHRMTARLRLVAAGAGS
jgi:cytochrome c oxidase assembly protein subunit 15